MLNSLRSIVQEVNAAPDLQAVLEIIVSRVREAMNTEVCSIYMLNPAMEQYVCMATEGLNRAAIGRVALKASEGLVGLVVTREEPINLDDAEAHPRYRYFPETGEERYCSFLGVPIIHHRKVLGVLVVQQVARRRFDEGEEAFLVTMSAQLAGAIAHAEATGALDGISISGDKKHNGKFFGVSGASGVAIGSALVIAPGADLHAVPMRQCDDIEAEIRYFDQCIQSVREDIENLGSKLSSRLNREEQALFDVYLRMLDDNSLGAEVKEVILQGQWAQGALAQVVLGHARTFEAMDDSYLRERAADVRDLGRRVLSYLQESGCNELEYPDHVILVGEEVSASMLGEVPKDRLRGIVSLQGSSNSHVAILARAMDIPTVMGAVDLPLNQLNHIELVVDGYNGVVYTQPSPELLEHFEQVCAEERQLVLGLEELRDKPCVTLDQHRVPLWVNTGLMADVVRSLDRGAEGVGLYRTEVPFLLRERFPSEEEQRAIYREQLEAFAPKPVTMRTLDIGGDKALPYFPIEEDNPFLGWRGIRVTLDHPEIFLVQVRAMLKASQGLNNLRIMLPMISNVSEVESALHLIHRAHFELKEEGVEVPLPPVGVMIEVPAAVYQARELAQRVDFLSVGSNDLTQYLLAVDRNNVRVADLYHSYHPAVLRAMQSVVAACHAEGKEVSVCGELAGDPGAALLLIAMGYDALSMSATNLPKVKSVIRQMSLTQARQLLAEVMNLDSPEVVRSYVELALEKEGLLQMVRPQDILTS